MILLLIEPDKNVVLSAVNWSSIDYTFGELSEFFVIHLKKNKPPKDIRSSGENERLFYGGGTQIYDYPTITKIKRLPKNASVLL